MNFASRIRDLFIPAAAVVRLAPRARPLTSLHSPAKVAQSKHPSFQAFLDSIQCGTYELGGKPVFWVCLPQWLSRDYMFVCGDEDGVAHVAVAPSFADGRKALEAMEARSPAPSDLSHDAEKALCSLDFVIFDQRFDPFMEIARHFVLYKSGHVDPHIDFHVKLEMTNRRLLDAGLGRIHALVGAERIALASRNCNSLHGVSKIGRLRLSRSVTSAVTSAMSSYPLLGSAICRGSLGLPPDVDDPIDAVHRVLEAAGVPAEQVFSLEKRLRGVDCGYSISLDHLFVLGRLPRDWFPSPYDRAGWSELILILPAMASAAASTGIPVEILCRHAGGHWARFVDRILAATGGDRTTDDRKFCTHFYANYRVPLAAADDIADMKRAFVNDLGLAILARTGAVDIKDEAAAADVARRALFEGRGMVHILEKSRLWHERGTSGDGPSRLSWPPVLPTWIDPVTGLTLLPLEDPDSLAHEGGNGNDPQGVPGLRHCVGGYWRDCLEDRIRIVSVRRVAEDGRFERVSTTEFIMDHGDAPRLYQHRGLDNNQPPQDAMRAVARYVAELDKGRLRIDRRSLDDARRRRSPVTVDDVCGYDWRDDAQFQKAIDGWTTFLQRRLRNLAPDDLVRALGYEVRG